MSLLSVSTIGLTQAIKKMDNIADKTPKALDVFLYREALDIFRKSQRIVPVDKGFLRSSGVVESNPGIAFIGYGGPAASYALYVHEDPEAQHKDGKTYKFLEIPFTDALPGIAERIAPLLEQTAEKA
jgi:hypothetical protein